jgi:hypothetical protein
MTENITAALAKAAAERAQRQAERPAIEAKGKEALLRLFNIAQGDTGQSGVIARFLLGLYNGDSFPFDLTNFRRLDFELFKDCLAVLQMDNQPRQEVHKYFQNGGERFRRLAEVWQVPDYFSDQIELRQYKELFVLPEEEDTHANSLEP